MKVEGCDLRSFAYRIGMDERDLKKVVVSQNYAFTGLKVADLICMGLGFSIADLARRGTLTIVPGSEHWNSSVRMAQDEYRTALEGVLDPETIETTPLALAYKMAGLEPPEPEEIEDRADALRWLRERLVQETDEQRERLVRDRGRSQAARQK